MFAAHLDTIWSPSSPDVPFLCFKEWGFFSGSTGNCLTLSCCLSLFHCLHQQFDYYNSLLINEKDENDNYVELGDEFILEPNEHFNNLLVNTTYSDIQLPTNVYNKGNGLYFLITSRLLWKLPVILKERMGIEKDN